LKGNYIWGYTTKKFEFQRSKNISALANMYDYIKGRICVMLAELLTWTAHISEATWDSWLKGTIHFMAICYTRAM
jgi:hypothetical protein